MKAAICYEFNKPLVIEDVTLEPPQKGEVKVRVKATAICHSDIHCIKVFPATKHPDILILSERV
jgi:S-(hydroxymethyl)glutathione dehydrogenase/alcohol dehydrogenase